MASTTFLLELYQQNCPIETFNALDATRFHFQILFVNMNNSIGRIAEGLLGRIAKCNDVIFVPLLFLATPYRYGNATPSDETNQMCSKLNLCLVCSTNLGTSCSIDNLDE